MSKPLVSPVTGSKNIGKKLSIKTQDVINAYEAEDLEKAEAYLRHTKSIDIYECKDTGYRFYYPFTIFGDDRFYEYLQVKRPSYSHLRWEHGPALKLINKNKRVLEVGSGSGEFLEQASTIAKEVRGLEFNQKAIASSKKRGLDVIGESIEKHAQSKSAYYDMVCMFQVLEHIWEVKSFLEASIRSIKKGGKLVIGVPNNNPYLFKHDVLHALNLPPHHSGLWNKRALSLLAKEFDLEVDTILIEPLNEPEYYWRIQQNYRKENSLILYFLCAPLSHRWLIKPRNFILRKFCKGRNILAIYTKR